MSDTLITDTLTIDALTIDTLTHWNERARAILVIGRRYHRAMALYKKLTDLTRLNICQPWLV